MMFIFTIRQICSRLVDMAWLGGVTEIIL